ncbi:MAG: hypothetical protein B7Y83_07015 [Flavobacteriales bacterium 32-34-25]|nr:MAG: hypothetical protein B7Y83_07015 [Flavobacteriales bacterium 32-34-25]
MMKNILYKTSLALCSLLISCGGGGDGAPESKNTAPSVPVLSSPTNNNLCIDNSISFQWNVSTDTEKNPIVYQIQVATDNQFTQIVKTAEVSSNTTTVGLDKGKAYYWRVKAIDSKNSSSNYSATYSLYTEGVALSNHLPFLPQLVSPDLSATIFSTSATLKWTASDTDVADLLSYDVYLDVNNPPTSKVASSITTTALDVNSLQTSKVYYWKVVVKDNKGGETIGQVWSFKSN